MEISESMVRHYLSCVTSYVGDIGCIPDGVTDYYNDIIEMKKGAIHQGDLDELRLAIDYLLTHPEINPPSFAQTHYHYDDDEFEELLLYIRSVVWPQLPPPDPEEVKDVKFINISASDWWDMRKAQSK